MATGSRYLGCSFVKFTQYFPQPGWVEHDPNEIWSTQVGVAAEAITKEGLSANNISGIGIK